MSWSYVSEKRATTQAELKSKVIHFAICSRLAILFLSFISNCILPDHNAGVYRFPSPLYQNESVPDVLVKTVFGGLVRWDAQYFLHISHYGYSYENTLAFFPLFPYLTRLLALCLDYVIGSTMNSLSTVLISAITVNFIFFVSAAVKLFELSCIVLQDNKLAYIAALLFCVNPASVFFTAPYSESCFSFFTFSAMLFCVKYDNSLLPSFASSLSLCVRSNGLMNFGYLAHKSVRGTVKLIKDKTPLYQVFCFAYNELWNLLIYFVVFLAPFAIFQCYVYFTFCLNKTVILSFLKEFGELKGFVMPDGVSPPWCNYSIPISYSYIQSHYWKVGFLRYYEVKQIPNFLLALPVIFLILSNSYLFMVENKKALISLGFNNDFVTYCDRKLRPEYFAFVTHALLLTLFCVLFIHVQVTTRMIASSCPVLYWFVAIRYKFDPSTAGAPIKSRLKNIQTTNKYCLVETHSNMNSSWKTVLITDKPVNLPSNVLRLYFCSYAIIGTVLFSNYYPWT